MRVLIMAPVHMWKRPIIIALLAAVVTYCKPSSDASQSQGRTDSSGTTDQASTTIVSSSSTGADVQTSSLTANGSSAAGDSDTPGALVTSPWVDTKRVMDNSTNAPGLQCAPRIFSRRDTLTLRMEHPHGEYLVVTQPDSTAFFLIYPQPDVSTRFLLMSSEVFAELPEVRFRADIRSKPQIYGRDTLEPVFQKPGKYTLMIGHKLESERSSGVYRCVVQLASEK
jgi:hypothetical protein